MALAQTPLDQALDAAMLLPPERREMLLAILQKRQAETQRHEIADDAQDSIATFRAGMLKAQSAEETAQDLHQDARYLE